MTRIHWYVDEKEVVLRKGAHGLRYIRYAQVNKCNNSIIIKGIEYFKKTAYKNIKNPYLLCDIRPEYIKTKFSFFFHKPIRYVPKGTIYELIETKNINIEISDFIMEVHN